MPAKLRQGAKAMPKRKPAAVMGSLVNLKNVASHKSIALTIHVPAEAAQDVLAAFGWPTMVDPVPVAVARLEAMAAQTEPVPKDLPEEPPERQPLDVLAEPGRTRHWAQLTPSQQTGIIRHEVLFQDFAGVHDPEAARNYIRDWCGVKSCADIVPGTDASVRWAQLQVRYGNWLRTARGAA
jgi:hypothetical protein